MTSSFPVPGRCPACSCRSGWHLFLLVTAVALATVLGPAGLPASRKRRPLSPRSHLWKKRLWICGPLSGRPRRPIAA